MFKLFRRKIVKKIERNKKKIHYFWFTINPKHKELSYIKK